MDDLPESSGSWYDDLEMDPDLQHEEKTLDEDTIMKMMKMGFWVNGVANTIISILGIIGMSQPTNYKSSLVQ